MADITDDYMRKRLSQARPYTVVILRHGPAWGAEGFEKLIWEHGRRNMSLQADGLLPIACPISDGSDLSGIGVFNASLEETTRILDGDPGVQEGIFTYEAHESRSFPGSSLP